MRKIRLIIYIILISMALLCVSPLVVKAENNADKIDSITIDVEVNNDGIASVTEVWVCSIYSGTELYKPFYDLSTSKISNLTISDETGTEYTYLSNWNINSSQSEKAGKCGIYISGNETDICWGIGEYGSHTYTIKYTISNFVQQYDDYQLINFTLIQDNMDPVPSSVKITISSSSDFDESNVSVSGYGYSGDAKIEDGKAVFTTSGSLGSTGYMNVYLKFANNPFNAEDMTLSNISMTNGDYIPEETMLNTTKNTTTSSKTWSTYVPLTIIIIIIVLVAVFIIFRRKDNNQNY